MSKKLPIKKSDYIYFQSISTRWNDNDIYGHINNVQYYSYFDTVVNFYLIEKAGLNIHSSSIVGYAVNSSCNYLSAISYPNMIYVGLRVNKIGNSSVTYGLAIFKKGSNKASAYGELTHVFVEKSKNKPTQIPTKIQNALKKLL